MVEKLSLESINACLAMKLKDLACNEIMFDPNTGLLLKNEQEKQKNIIDNIFKKLEDEKYAVEQLNEEIALKKAEYETAQNVVKEAETKSNEAIHRVTIKHQEYNTAENNVQQATHAYNAQVTHINGIEGQLAATNKALDYYARCPCPRRDELIQQQQTQKQQLNQAKNDLNSKNVDKTNKEQIKIQINTELQNDLATKNQAESDLTKFKKEQDRVNIDMQEIETEKNRFNIEAGIKDLDLAKQKADVINEMINQLTIQANEAENEEIIESEETQIDEESSAPINTPTTELQSGYEL